MLYDAPQCTRWQCTRPHKRSVKYTRGQRAGAYESSTMSPAVFCGLVWLWCTDLTVLVYLIAGLALLSKSSIIQVQYDFEDRNQKYCKESHLLLILISNNIYIPPVNILLCIHCFYIIVLARLSHLYGTQNICHKITVINGTWTSRMSGTFIKNQPSQSPWQSWGRVRWPLR